MYNKTGLERKFPCNHDQRNIAKMLNSPFIQFRKHKSNFPLAFIQIDYYCTVVLLLTFKLNVHVCLNVSLFLFYCVCVVFPLYASLLY